MSIDLKELIQILPDLIMLLLPGWIFLFLYRFCARRPHKTSVIALENIISSYVLTLCYTSVSNYFFKTTSIVPIVLLSFSAAIGVLLGCIRVSSFVKEHVGEIFGIRLEESVWEGIADMQKGVYVRVFLEGENLVYKGIYRRYYLSSGETWIQLQEYTVRQITNVSYEEENKLPCLYSYKSKANHLVAINTKDIKRIELLYDKDSKKL